MVDPYRDGDAYLEEQLRDIDRRRELIVATLYSNKSKRPGRLRSWWRILLGKCPVCLAELQTTDSYYTPHYDKIETRCPVDITHYHDVRLYVPDNPFM